MARGVRDYGTAPAKGPGAGGSLPRSGVAALRYIPTSPLGAEHGPDQGPIARRSLHTQVLGSVVGRRGAGITTLASGDPTAHSVNHYGKQGLPGLDGGDFESGF